MELQSEGEEEAEDCENEKDVEEEKDDGDDEKDFFFTKHNVMITRRRGVITS